MNAIQESKLGRYYLIMNTCQQYKSTWIDNTVFAASYNLWSALIPLIEKNRDAQMPENTGIATDKATKRILMAEKALFVENRLQSYANAVGNPELLESVSYTPTDLKKARDTEVTGICNTILAKAKLYAKDIEPYGVTTGLITDLEQAITAYSARLPKPKAAKSQTKTATENLRELYKNSDKYLRERLDLDIELFKTENPEFYSQYKTARFSTSNGSKTIALSGKAIMAGVGEPIKGVTFVITPQQNGAAKISTMEAVKPIVKKSAKKGSFRLANLAEGIYQVVVKKTGFVQQEFTVTVNKGETTRLRVELVKS